MAPDILLWPPEGTDEWVEFHGVSVNVHVETWGIYLREWCNSPNVKKVGEVEVRWFWGGRTIVLPETCLNLDEVLAATEKLAHQIFDLGTCRLEKGWSYRGNVDSPATDIHHIENIYELAAHRNDPSTRPPRKYVHRDPEIDWSLEREYCGSDNETQTRRVR